MIFLKLGTKVTCKESKNNHVGLQQTEKLLHHKGKNELKVWTTVLGNHVSGRGFLPEIHNTLTVLHGNLKQQQIIHPKLGRGPKLDISAKRTENPHQGVPRLWSGGHNRRDTRGHMLPKSEEK